MLNLSINEQKQIIGGRTYRVDVYDYDIGNFLWSYSYSNHSDAQSQASYMNKQYFSGTKHRKYYAVVEEE